MTELKPCPFCGEFYVRWSPGKKRRYLHVVRCDNCRFTTRGFKTQEAATEFWNRRHIDREMLQKIVMLARVVFDPDTTVVYYEYDLDEILAELEKEQNGK